jgi:hypothetical protein
MSVWGPGPFENDDAADWFGELEEGRSLDLVREALDEVADPEHIGPIEVAECCEAVGAATVLAELCGVPGATSHFEGLEATAAELRLAWDGESIREQRRLIRQALNALVVVLNDEEHSELRQLWEQSENGLAEWAAAMQDLATRLKQVDRHQP